MNEEGKNVHDGDRALTTGEAAEAIGVSESSLKRWCDRGKIPSHRTAGGHRRVALSALLRFVRKNKYEISKPALLGLASTVRGASLAELSTRLYDALVEGDASRVSQLGLELFISVDSLTTIFDQVIAPALERIGSQWHAGELAIYRERRAVNLVLALLGEIRRLTPPPASDAPRAIGATLAGDHYAVAVTMGELVLAELGWNAATIGSNVPTSTLLVALEETRPRLLWINLSHIENEAQLVTSYAQLYDYAIARNVAVAVGGPALTKAVRSEIRATAFGSSMAELAELGRALRSVRAKPG